MKERLRYLTRNEFPLQRIFASQIFQNIITNYLAVVWMGGLSLALIPLYFKRLGPDQWGVVAICMAIQGFLGLLDAGLGQIMPRDIARVAGDRGAVARVFRVFSRAYFGLGFIGLVLGQAGVHWLVVRWFNQGQGVADGADLALRLVLVQFFFQFANNAHVGYWNGLQAQKQANFRQCAFGTARHASALALVYTWRADAIAYLMPFVFISAIEWWSNFRLVRRGLGDFVDGEVSIEELRTLAREAGWLAVGILIGMLVSQIDRIVLSRSVDMASYGRYVIVANLGLAFMQLQYPLMRAFFPRIVQMNVHRGFSSQWKLGLGVFLLCVLPCGFVAVLAPWLLKFWLGDPQIVSEGVAPLRLIIGAVAVNAVYHLIYQHIIAKGQGWLVLLINLIALAIVTPMIIFSVHKYGIAAGGLAWMLGSIIQLGFGMLWMLNNRMQQKKNRILVNE